MQECTGSRVGDGTSVPVQVRVLYSSVKNIGVSTVPRHRKDTSMVRYPYCSAAVKTAKGHDRQARHLARSRPRGSADEHQDVRTPNRITPNLGLVRSGSDWERAGRRSEVRTVAGDMAYSWRRLLRLADWGGNDKLHQRVLREFGTSVSNLNVRLHIQLCETVKVLMHDDAQQYRTVP